MRRPSTEAEESQVGLKFLYRVGESSDSPLLVFVHGRAGNRAVMWPFERCVPSSWHIVAFEGFLADPIGGWSWWDMSVEGSRRDSIGLACQRVRSALAEFQRMIGLSPRSLIGCGFSQGAILVSGAAFEGIIPFDGIALLAGFPLLPKEPRQVHTKEVFEAHGVLDDVIPVARAREGVDTLETLGISVEYVEEEVGHKVGIKGTRALQQWLQSWV